MAPPFVKRYLIALERHKWAGVAGFVVVLGLSGVAALQPAPPSVYRTEGLLSYISPPITVSETGLALQQQGQSLTPEMLLSDFVVESVVQQLLTQQIEVTPQTIRSRSNIRVNPDEDVPGFNVRVTYQDADDERSLLIGTLLMEAIVEQSRQFNTQQLNKILENLNQLLPEVERELRAAENDLERYIRVEGPAIQAAEDGALVGSITSSQQQQRQLQYLLAGIDAQIQSLQNRLGLTPDQAYASSALSADPIIADLRAQIHQAETQFEIFSQSLRPDHPTMVELRSQRAAFERLLQQRVSEVLGGNDVAAPIRASEAIRQASSLDPARQQLADTLVTLQRERETLQRQFEQLSAEEQELRQEYTTIPNKQLELARLQQQVVLKQNFYDQLQARLADVTIAENETVGSLVVTRPPDVELVEEEPRSPVMILVVGGFVGILVGGGLVLLLDSLDATFHTLQELQGALRQQETTVLGLLPIMAYDRSAEDALPLIVEPDSPYAESYERVRSALRRAGGSKPVKVILLTSTVEQEGKTVTSYNLAIASARAGKRTLLVEGDLRSPSHARSLKVAPDPDSLVEPLRYYGQLHECIRLVPDVENLYILPSPGPQRQASAIIESSEIRRLLEDARGRFDLVLIDSPSLSRYSDALLLEPLTDGLLLVTRPGKTEEGLLNEAIEQFTESDDIQFLGAIINGADLPIQSNELKAEEPEPFIVEDLDGQPEVEEVQV